MSTENTDAEDYDDEDTSPLAERDLLLEIIRCLVDTSGLVKVEEVLQSDSHSILKMHVDELDRGKVIGKDGTTFSTLVQLFNKIGSRTGKKIYLELAGQDPEGYVKQKRGQDRPDRPAYPKRPYPRHRSNV